MMFAHDCALQFWKIKFWQPSII